MCENLTVWNWNPAGLLRSSGQRVGFKKEGVILYPL